MRKLSLSKKASVRPTGFVTGSGKPVQVKESALQKAKSIFDGILDETDQSNSVLKLDQPPEHSSPSFRVPLSKSEAGSSKASNIRNSPAAPARLPVGFKTANEQTITITKSSLEKTKGFFDGIIDDSKEPNLALDIPQSKIVDANLTVPVAEAPRSFASTSNVSSPFRKHVGFTTASGQEVKVGKSSLKKTKGFFDGIIDDSKEEPILTLQPENVGEDFIVPITEAPRSSTSTSSASSSFRTHVGFTTASGQEVKVATSSLKETKGFFEGIIDESKEVPNLTLDIPQSESTVANSTCPSTQSSPIQIAQNIFGDFPDDDTDFEDCVIESPCSKSTSIVTTPIVVHRRGKKLFEELVQESPEYDNESLEPLGKKFKASRSRPSSVRLMNVRAKHDSMGSMTQEVLDSTLALLADEEESSFPQDSEMSENTGHHGYLPSPSPPESPPDMEAEITSRILPKVHAAREAARLAQEMRIRYVVSILVKPSPGLLWQRRQNSSNDRISISELSKSPPRQYTERQLSKFNLKRSILSINAGNVVDFRFSVSEFYCEYMALRNGEGIFVEDDICLVLSPDSTLGAEEFANGLMACPTVDPRLISVQWVTNHYRWIVWTLANYEMKFPRLFAGRALTPENVAQRLKYRYDREIDKSQRSAIHRITEQDDVASKRMVLMVSDINIPEGEDQRKGSTLHSSSLMDKTAESTRNSLPNKSDPGITLELSDGWYSIPAVSDDNIASFVEKGLIKIGTKLILQNAELVGTTASHPLETDGKVVLKFGANSSRRVHWNTRLGYCKQSMAFPLILDSIIYTGGVVPLIHMIIARTYPVIYMRKSAPGKPFFETSRAYERNQRVREMERQSKVEKLQLEIEEEVRKSYAKSKSGRRQSVQTSFKREVLEAMSPEDLFDLMECHGDSASIESALSRGKLDQMQEFRYRQMEKMRSKVHSELESRLKEMDEASREPQPVPILKMRIVDAKNVSVKPRRSYAILSIWRPSEELQQMLKEGSAFQVFSLLPSNTHPIEIRLNSTRTTKFLPLQGANMTHYEPVRRKCYSLFEILDEDFEPTFGEFDTVGLVVYITPFVQSTGQVAYVADADKNIMGVKFWTPITNQGLEEVVKIGNFLLFTNLQWRAASSTSKIPTAFVHEHTLFTQNPKDSTMNRLLSELRDDLVDPKRFAVSCEMKVYSLLSGRTSYNQN